MTKWAKQNRAIASYNSVVSTGSSILGNMNEVASRNRSTSAAKRQRETEGNTTPPEDKRAKGAQKTAKGHMSRKK